MCLAVPGKVVTIEHGTSPLMATVSFNGVQKAICLEWLPETVPGDYVIVHVGFAISTVDEEEALATIRDIASMGAEGDQEDDAIR